MDNNYAIQHLEIRLSIPPFGSTINVILSAVIYVYLLLLSTCSLLYSTLSHSVPTILLLFPSPRLSFPPSFLYLQAARVGNLDVLRWARANGCPWNVLTCAYAAAAGHLDILRWARKEGCPWNEATCAFAAAGGHLEVLKWCRANGCPWGEETCASAARGARLEVRGVSVGALLLRALVAHVRIACYRQFFMVKVCINICVNAFLLNGWMYLCIWAVCLKGFA